VAHGAGAITSIVSTLAIVASLMLSASSVTGDNPGQTPQLGRFG